MHREPAELGHRFVRIGDFDNVAEAKSFDLGILKNPAQSIMNAQNESKGASKNITGSAPGHQAKNLKVSIHLGSSKKSHDGIRAPVPQRSSDMPMDQNAEAQVPLRLSSPAEAAKLLF